MPTSSRSRYLRWLRDIIILLLIVAGVQWWQARSMARGEAPPLVGPSIDGGELSLEQLRGQPVLVHFWATWCPICRLEEGSIDSIADDYAVLSVATTSGDAAELRAYMREQGLEFPVLLDETGDLTRRWGLQGVPATFIVDGEGRIEHASRGYSTEWGLRLRLVFIE